MRKPHIGKSTRNRENTETLQKVVEIMQTTEVCMKPLSDRD